MYTKPIQGLEASRRAGWAKFFSAKEENEALRDENAKLKWAVRLLAKRIAFHVRLDSDDDLVKLARELELSL
jgi:hypothetical protein